MEGIAKVFRGKEKRKAVDTLAKDVRRAIELSTTTNHPYSQPLSILSLADYSVKESLDRNGERRYVLFYGDDVIVSIGHSADRDVAADTIVCAIIAHFGRAR